MLLGVSPSAVSSLLRVLDSVTASRQNIFLFFFFFYLLGWLCKSRFLLLLHPDHNCLEMQADTKSLDVQKTSLQPLDLEHLGCGVVWVFLMSEKEAIYDA